MIIGLDPGNERSAAVLFDPVERRVLTTFIDDNQSVLTWLHRIHPYRQLAIEMISSYGMPVGREVFETCVWIGRFIQVWCPAEAQLLYRKDIKLHLCGSSRAKDANVRVALIDKFGGRAAAIGKKAKPGPLYGVKSHLWSALAVAVCFAETRIPEVVTA